MPVTAHSVTARAPARAWTRESPNRMAVALRPPASTDGCAMVSGQQRGPGPTRPRFSLGRILRRTRDSTMGPCLLCGTTDGGPTDEHAVPLWARRAFDIQSPAPVVPAPFPSRTAQQARTDLPF